MDIDLREIQALHARYANDTHVIDLEVQVRQRPAPLLLAHTASPRHSMLRRTWDARGSIARTVLMIAGASALCAGIGVGAARAWNATYGAHRPAVPTPGHPASAAVATQPPAAAPVGTAGHSLTSGAFASSVESASGLATIDAVALTRASSAGNAGRTAEQVRPPANVVQAAASPIYQHRPPQAPAFADTTVPATPEKSVAAPAASAPAAALPAQPAVRPARRAPLHRATPAVPEPAEKTDSAKSHPAPRSGDVQLF